MPINNIKISLFSYWIKNCGTECAAVQSKAQINDADPDFLPKQAVINH